MNSYNEYKFWVVLGVILIFMTLFVLIIVLALLLCQMILMNDSGQIINYVLVFVLLITCTLVILIYTNKLVLKIEINDIDLNIKTFLKSHTLNIAELKLIIKGNILLIVFNRRKIPMIILKDYFNQENVEYLTRIISKTR